MVVSQKQKPSIMDPSQMSNGNSNGDMELQMAAMQKMLAEQAEKMRLQQEALERERQERQRDQAEMEKERQRMDSGSRMTSNGDDDSVSSELEILRKQLAAREQELKTKDDQLKERDERLSLMSQRSNSEMSDEAYYSNTSSKVGEVPEVRLCSCDCTDKGFERCVMYKKHVCACSFSCNFVKDYLKPPRGHSFYLA
ncbi:protein enabled homolog isoform X1 [Tigriopus californicus]|nr:protein enabled homolog isoform X1 [Tigriopus californicus]